MLEIVSWFMIFFITYIIDCYIFSKLINEKMLVNKKIIFLVLIQVLINCYTMTINNVLIRAVITNTFLVILLREVYKKSLARTVIGVLIVYFGYAISETIFVVIFITIFKFSSNFLLKTMLGFLISNSVIILFNVLLFKRKFILNLSQSILGWYKENDYVNAVILTLLSVIVSFSLMYPSSQLDPNYLKIIVNSLMVISIVIFITGYFKEKSGNNKLNIEYAQLLEYVKTYEDEVVDKSKKQHEYKNQLIIIDNLIPKTNKKAKDYLKKVLNNVVDVTDDDWLVKLKNLPSGGIKGLIHFKIKKMIDKKISVFVYVDKELSKKNIWENIEKNLEDISRILGVYLDNAIEASEKSIDKQIIIEFVNDKKDIEFILSNSYYGNINFDELDKDGYSTKGKGRGVGLSLVKDIIDNNKLLNQSREINGKFYVQKLYIKK